MTRLLLLEPYGSDSHRSWAEGYAENSAHDVRSVVLPGERWRLRMREGAAELNSRSRDICADGWRPDVVLVSSMVNVADLRRLLSEWIHDERLVTYFHESQLAYPDIDVRGSARPPQSEFVDINLVSIAASDLVLFNSAHHLTEASRPRLFFRHLRAEVVPVGVDLAPFAVAGSRPPVAEPLILWNHRWDHDKDPQTFFAALNEVNDLPWRLAVVGANTRIDPQEFDHAAEAFFDRILTWGHQPRAAYIELLHQADLVVSTARHEFFGVAMVEAMAAGAVPVLPNGLSYPELVPSEFHETVLYDGDVASALRARLTNLEAARAAVSGLADSMHRFSWDVIAPRMDALVSPG